MKNKKSSIRKRFGLANTFIILFLALFVVVELTLFLWGLTTSVKTEIDFDWMKNTVGLPSGSIGEWGWDNFSYVIEKFAVEKPDGQYAQILETIFNTLFYSLTSAFMHIAAVVITGYCVAKYNYRFSKFVYAMVLVIMTVPIIGSTPSMLVLLKKVLRVYDTWFSNFLMKFNFAGVYFMLMHAAFFRIPKDFSEAATIDGAGEFTIFFRIMIPMVIPTIATIFLIYFIDYWNDYNTVLLYLPSHPTLAYGVFKLSVSRDNMMNVPKRLVSCMLMAIPILILFLSFRNKIMGNVTSGGVKE